MGRHAQWLLLSAVCFVLHCAAQENQCFSKLAEDYQIWNYSSNACADFCRRITCETVENCPTGRIEKNGSMCGCCDICVKYINEKENCNLPKPPKGKAEAACAPGLICENSTCVKKMDSCQAQVDWRKHLKKNDPRYSEDLWIPTCDKNGNFTAKQCKMHKCVCMDEVGNRIFGQAEKDTKTAENMTCACSRAMEELRKNDRRKWMTEPQQHCTESGDYDVLQCIGKICYCSDPATGKPIGKTTPLEMLNLLPCYDSEIHEEKYLRQCEKQLIQSRSVVYGFSEKGVTVESLEKESCDVDGTFSPKQCTTERCICANREGLQFMSYGIDSREDHRGMTCRCARDEFDRTMRHAQYEKLTCSALGNFEPVQLQDENYCVDEDGDIIALIPSKNTVKKEQEKLCLELLDNLKLYSSGITPTTTQKTISTQDNETSSTEWNRTMQQTSTEPIEEVQAEADQQQVEANVSTTAAGQ